MFLVWLLLLALTLVPSSLVGVLRAGRQELIDFRIYLFNPTRQLRDLAFLERIHLVKLHA